MKKFGTDVSTDVVKDYYADDEGHLTVSYTQDVEPIINRNRAIRAMQENGHGHKDLKHVASIPMTVVLAWAKHGIDIYDKNDWPKIKTLLNDPHWRMLRTGGGRI